jgi:ABC-type glycerol-3-phosphate transport system permease component
MTAKDIYAVLAQGTYTCQMVCHRVAPSILAASDRARGMVLKLCRRRKMAMALPRKGSMMPNFVSMKPISERVIKLGIINTSLGMIICMKIMTITRDCPLKRYIASAYPAKVEVKN